MPTLAKSAVNLNPCRGAIGQTLTETSRAFEGPAPGASAQLAKTYSTKGS